MKISGNTIFIPGSTSGIGLALALALQAKGNTVIVGGRRQELLDDRLRGIEQPAGRIELDDKTLRLLAVRLANPSRDVIRGSRSDGPIDTDHGHRLATHHCGQQENQPSDRER